jgi:hypothetical protein
VYVAHDDRIATKPAWLLSDHLVSESKGFAPTGDKVMIGGYSYTVYLVEMDRDESVNISGNKANPAEEGNMFVVFAKERRILNEFLYDDFEAQQADEEPEGWILSTPGGRTVKIEAMERGGDAANKAMRLVDKTAGAYALASRKFSPLLSGKYSVKWKVYENTSGARLQYQRVVLHDGPPLEDATLPNYYMIETYLHGGYFTYRLIGGNSAGGTSQIQLGPQLAARTWHEIELTVDADRKTYDVAINGTTYGTGIPYTTSAQGKKADHIVIGTRQSGDDNDIYYDDVIITPLDSLALSPIADQAVEAGAGFELEAPLEFYPYDAELAVQSGDPSVAAARIVGGGGDRRVEIAGIAAGAADITVTAEDDSGRTLSAAFAVSVTAPRAPTLDAPEDVTGLRVGGTRTVLAAYAPVRATSVSAISENEDVATVTAHWADGTASLVVRGESAGSARIAVTAERPGGLAATARFSVFVGDAGGEPVLLDVSFDDLPAGAFGITGDPIPNIALPQLTKVLNPASASASVVDGGGGDKYFALQSPSADTKAVFGFEPAASGTVTVEFKWLPDPAQNNASISIVGGSGGGGGAADCAFTIMKVGASQIAYRTGGAANTNNAVISDWSAGRWISVRVEMDVAAQTYKLWVDGTQRLYQSSENIPYRYPINTAGGAIWGVAAGKASGVSATVGIDAIKVTAPAPAA